jgi:hypothetical protein
MTGEADLFGDRPPKKTSATRPPIERRPYSERELAIIAAFKWVSMFPGTSQKRFIRDLISAAEHARDLGITEKQARYLVILAWRYRRQLPAQLAYPTIEGDEGIIHGFEVIPGQAGKQNG